MSGRPGTHDDGGTSPPTWTPQHTAELVVHAAQAGDGEGRGVAGRPARQLARSAKPSGSSSGPTATTLSSFSPTYSNRVMRANSGTT